LSKGDKRRPREISDEELNKNWEKIFKEGPFKEAIKIEMAMIEKEWYELQNKLH
jgi:hypothetical protein